MVAKLSRPGTPAQAQSSEPAQEARVQPKGWGAKPAPVQTDVEDVAPSNQRERMNEQLTGQAAPGVVDARSAFSRGVQEQRAAIGGDVAGEQHSNGVRTDQPEQGDQGDAKPARRSRKAVEAGVEVAPASPVQLFAQDAGAAIVAARASLMAAVVASDPTATVDDLVGAAEELWKWVAAA